MEGRKVWSKLSCVSASLARNIWMHVIERDGELGKQDLLGKVSFLNLVVAFAIALKHKIRFEPYTRYEDLQDLVGHLDTFARVAGQPSPREPVRPFMKHLNNLLRVAEANPRRELKRAKRPLGNLPLEILSYMGAYIQSINDNETFKSLSTICVVDNLQQLDDVLVTADRILNTPLPIAYTIAISQITWIYLLTLPIQLVHLMGWISVPVVLVSAYIILGMAAIGNEIENPFGIEVNDLPVELYCAQIASDIAIISSRPAAKFEDYVLHPDAKPLYPIDSKGSRYWPDASAEDIRSALRTRAAIGKKSIWRRMSAPVDILEALSPQQSMGGSTLNQQGA